MGPILRCELMWVGSLICPLLLIGSIYAQGDIAEEKRRKRKVSSSSSTTDSSSSSSSSSCPFLVGIGNYLPVKPHISKRSSSSSSSSSSRSKPRRRTGKDEMRQMRPGRKPVSSAVGNVQHRPVCKGSSSSSEGNCERNPMYNQPAPCTNCGCAPDNRFTCDALEIPLRKLPSGCGIPTGFFTAKRVLVIGATSGIGLATAQLFQYYGALVVGTSRNPPTKGCAFTWPLMKLDIGVEESIDPFIEEYIKRYGNPPDILIDNGARAVFGMSADIDEDWAGYAMRNQATGHIRLIRGFIKRLPYKKSSFISLSTLSAAAYYSLPGSTYYTAPKQVLRQFIQNWGLENSPVYPNVFLGFIAPPFTKTNFARNAHYARVQENELTASVRRLYMNLVAGGIDPVWVARAFVEVAYMRVQGQTCDIGYLAVNPDDYGTVIEFNSQMTNFWNNKVPIEYAQAVGPYFSQLGCTFTYNTTFTQCPQGQY